MKIYDDVQQNIQELRKGVPKYILDAIDSFDWQKELEIMMRHEGYPIDEIGRVAVLIELTFYGGIDPSEFSETLESRLNFSPDEAQELTRALNARIFKPIQERVLEKQKDSGADDNSKHPDRESVLSEIESINAPKKTTDTQGKSLVQKKLESLFHTKPSETKHSIEKDTPTPQKTQSYTEGEDPYQEPID